MIISFYLHRLVLLLLLTLFVPAIAAPDTPEEFSNWFIQQDFPKNEYYQWAAIFEALIDGNHFDNKEQVPSFK